MALFIFLSIHSADCLPGMPNLNHAYALFATAVHPYARMALERGIESGRFVVPDIEVTVTAVAGGAFALIREILEGQQASVDRAFATHVLLSLGLAADDAARASEAALGGERQEAAPASSRR